MAHGGKRDGAGRKGNELAEIKKTLLEEMRAKYPDYNPVVAMADIAHDDSQIIDLRFQAHKEISKYFFPQLKAVETKDTSENIRVYKVVYEDGGDNPAKTTTPESGEDTQGSEAV